MVQKAEMEFGGKKIHPVTDSDVVIHNGGSLTTALDNAISYSPATSASAFGKQILTCKSAADLRNLLKVAPDNVFDETGGYVNYATCIVRDDKSAEGFGKTVLCPADKFLKKYVKFTQNSFTVDFFMCPNADLGGSVTIIYISIPGKTDVLLGTNSSRGTRLAKADSSGTAIGTSASLNYGTTRKFNRITYDSGTWTWYFNGVKKQSGTYDIELPNKQLAFRFGADDVPLFYDEIRILEGVVLDTDVPTAPFSISDYPTKTRCLLHCDSI